MQSDAFINTIDILASSPNSNIMDKRLAELPDNREKCIRQYLDSRRAEQEKEAAVKYHADVVAMPAAQAAIQTFGVNPDSIAYVSWTHQTAGEGGDVGVVEVVAVKGGPDYYYRPESGQIFAEKPFGFSWDDVESSPMDSFAPVP